MTDWHPSYGGDPPDADTTIPLGRPSIRYYPYVRVVAINPDTNVEYIDTELIGIYADNFAAERAFNDWCRDNPTTRVHQFVKEHRVVAPLPMDPPMDPPTEGEPW